jgi:hypothetical protein
MTMELFTVWVTAAILIFTGYHFFIDLARALRRRAQKAELHRYISALERLDTDMVGHEREGGPKTSIPDEQPYRMAVPVIPDPIPDPFPQRTAQAGGLPNDQLPEGPSARRRAIAEAHRRALERRMVERQVLISQALVGAGLRERELLSETTLDPRSEESIMQFLRKARELREKQATEMGSSSEPALPSR